ncbi:MAG: DNA polymerase/3'-5' exonuclease PolX [Bdellovibrionales bacterium]|nr:DNA polymerase/3'-5' exonuclease PolX [Bdellovibrionales bacterium]
MMDSYEVAKKLEQTAMIMELKGENPFKIRAYKNGAQALQQLEQDFSTLVKEETLTQVKGIGKGLATDILQWVHEGHSQYYIELMKEFPDTIFELFEVPQLGPKKLKVLHDELGVSSLIELEYACVENKLVDLKGFGRKTQDKLLHGIEFLKKNKGRFLYADVIDIVEDLVQQLSEWDIVERVSLAGSLRRKKEIVKDADIVCASETPDEVMNRFVHLDSVGNILSQGSTKSSVIWSNGLQIDLRVVSIHDFPYTLHHFTGSREHNTILRSMAKRKGLKINEYGIYRGEEKIVCTNESQFFETFSLSYIEPELREGQNEIELAGQNKLPTLISEEDIQGFFHMHSTYSDGKHSLEEMIQESLRKGMKYVGVSEHSQTAFYSRGLKDEQIQKQHREIDELQEKYPDIRIFKGIESDILSDGRLDYSDAVLESFDFVIASVHSNFQMSEEDMTQRCIQALKNPYCTMLGHPTGRLLLGRDGFKIHVPSILEVAVGEGKVIELNANPHRLDLDWRWLPMLQKLGGKVSINPDAHSLEGISDIRFGINVARKGMLGAKDVLNTQSLKDIEKFLGV